EYPLCYLDLEDAQSPVSVHLEAFTPMIPLDADNSGIPCGILSYSVTNTTGASLEFTLAGTLPNTACHPLEDATVWSNFNHPMMKTTRGTLYEEEGFASIHFTNDNGDKTALRYSDSTLSVLGSGTVAALPQWPDTGWWDAGQLFWDSLRDYGNFDGISQEMSCSETVKSGSLGLCDTLAPGETKTVTFLISWNVPNRINGWTEPEPCCCSGCCETPKQTKNYYAVKFADSLATARYVGKNFTMLCEATHRFHDGL
ncbi:MAG: GH116 family glycosyl-hydrolase, partial [Oscillospiraceae bacterium]